MGRALTAGSLILSERSRWHYHQHPTGHFSIKTMRGGRAIYEIEGGRRIAVDDTGYLILNERQPYTITIDSPLPLESFCIFFPDALAGDVFHALTQPAAALLDAPAPPDFGAPRFFETLVPHDSLVSPVLQELRAASKSGVLEIGWLLERLGTLVAGMLHAHQHITARAAALPAARPATRVELYRRLCIARDYLHSSFHEPLTLADLARVAALSPFHLQRSYKQAFGKTPHDTLTRLRLDQARLLLCHTAQPVTEICLSLGFASLGSFSTLFRTSTGLSPRQYRAAHSPCP